MTRRGILGGLVAAAAAAAAARFGWLAKGSSELGAVAASGAQGDPQAQGGRLELSEQRWRNLLDASAFAVLRQEHTERPGSSPLNDEKRMGTFVCAGCFSPLFLSSHKYESGTGWPSFFDVIAGRVGTRTDFKLVLPRTEYHCARCEGHQGHVFEDGPQPTGLRYCNNGVALRFVPDGEPLPELRQA